MFRKRPRSLPGKTWRQPFDSLASVMANQQVRMSESSASGSKYTLVLVEGHTGARPVAPVRKGSFRQLHAHVLNGVGGDLWPDQFLHHIEQTVLGQQPERGGAGAHRGVGADVP